MSAPRLPLPLAAPIPVTLKKKRVLLIDQSTSKRELRAEVMRKLGMEVDCAADIGEARSWWRADLYNLVLLNVQNGNGQRDEFCGDIRRAVPPQQLAFLVGKPDYLADSPKADEPESAVEMSNPALLGAARSAAPSDFGVPNQRWGILEASRQISAVRSASVARTRALQNLPVPPRDSEGRTSKRAAAAASLDWLGKEMQ